MAVELGPLQQRVYGRAVVLAGMLHARMPSRDGYESILGEIRESMASVLRVHARVRDWERHAWLCAVIAVCRFVLLGFLAAN